MISAVGTSLMPPIFMYKMNLLSSTQSFVLASTPVTSKNFWRISYHDSFLAGTEGWTLAASSIANV